MSTATAPSSTMSITGTMPTVGKMPTASIRDELLRRVNVLPSNDCATVLHCIDTLESEWSAEEWEALCEEFEHSPEKAIEKAERRAGFLAPKQS